MWRKLSRKEDKRIQEANKLCNKGDCHPWRFFRSWFYQSKCRMKLIIRPKMVKTESTIELTQTIWLRAKGADSKDSVHNVAFCSIFHTAMDPFNHLQFHHHLDHQIHLKNQSYNINSCGANSTAIKLLVNWKNVTKRSCIGERTSLCCRKVHPERIILKKLQGWSMNG